MLVSFAQRPPTLRQKINFQRSLFLSNWQSIIGRPFFVVWSKMIFFSWPKIVVFSLIIPLSFFLFSSFQSKTKSQASLYCSLFIWIKNMLKDDHYSFTSFFLVLNTVKISNGIYAIFGIGDDFRCFQISRLSI